MIHRLGAVSGLIGVALLVWSFGMFSGSQSWPEDPDSVVLTELIEAGRDSDGAMMVAMFGVPFLVAFGGFAADRFRRHGLAGWIGWTFASGMVLFGVVWMIVGSVGQMSSILGDIPGAEGIARFIVVFGWSSTSLFIPAIFAIGGTAVIASFAADALPKPVGYGAGVVMLSALAPWIGGFVLLLWIVITSLVLTVDRTKELVTT